MVMDRKGVSPVIATVLLLVLTIVIGGIIFSVVIPFVKDSLGDSRVCLDALEGVEFPESKFNCYDITVSTDKKTGFSIKLNKEGIVGFRVALTDDDGSSDVYDIKNGITVVSGVRMVGKSSDAPIEFPSVGGQRSYVANKKYMKAELSPITVSGEICAVADVVEFSLCYNDVVL
ncbi:MAG: archaellin/type IV pilin N-terminal domain-containing protein [Nanoarchaeota archaeon]